MKGGGDRGWSWRRSVGAIADGCPGGWGTMARSGWGGVGRVGRMLDVEGKPVPETVAAHRGTGCILDLALQSVDFLLDHRVDFKQDLSLLLLEELVSHQ